MRQQKLLKNIKLNWLLLIDIEIHTELNISSVLFPRQLYISFLFPEQQTRHA